MRRRDDFERNDPSWGRPGGAGQSSGGAYPNRAGAGRFEGGQSGQSYYGPGQLGQGRSPNAASQARDRHPRDERGDERGWREPPRFDDRHQAAQYRDERRPAFAPEDRGDRRPRDHHDDDRAPYRAWGADVSGGDAPPPRPRHDEPPRGRGDASDGYRMQGYGYRMDRHRDDDRR